MDLVAVVNISQTTNFRLSKLKEFPDDNTKFDKNDGKFSEWVETLWEKEKLLFMSNFSFSHSIKTCNADTSKPGLVWERVKPFPNEPWFLRVCSTSHLKKKKNVGKGEITRYEQFLLYSLCFLLL